MSQSARVSSLEALVDMKAALCVFTSDAKEALSTLAMEIQRTLNWLDEQLKYWSAAVRKCEDAVIEAKNELTRKRMMRIGDRPPDCSDQEKALRIARERLAFAEDKVEKVRHWLRQLPDEIRDYEGTVRQLGGMLESDMPKVDAFLEGKIAALDAYLQAAGLAPRAAPVRTATTPGTADTPATSPDTAGAKGAEA